jgi:hypothetical protein
MWGGTWHTTGWYGPNASNAPGSFGQVFAGAGNSGGYWPFWDTQAYRAAAGDLRLSLQEWYGTHAGYVCVVTAAANWAVQQRFLLASDAQTLISNAAASNVLGPPTCRRRQILPWLILCARIKVSFLSDRILDGGLGQADPPFYLRNSRSDCPIAGLTQIVWRTR